MTDPALRKRLGSLAPFLLVGLLGGCQSLSMPGVFGGSEDRQPLPGTLATLEAAEPTPESHGGAAAEVTLSEVMESYRALLPLLEDPAKRVAVRHRLADLEFLRAENKMVETAEDEMAGAIEAYEQLLAEYPDRRGNDQVLYQLARAYDLRGMSEQYLATLTTLVKDYPESEFWVEAQFRRGDLLFSNRQYGSAEQAFRTVIEAGPERRDDESFLVNAHYMLGWSQFKQGDYQQALYSYIDVLDLVMPEDQEVESVGQEYRTMMEDLFRVFGLSLSYLDGADTLQAIFRTTGEKSYEILVYDRYSELLLEREQFTDAIDVYERYIDATEPVGAEIPHTDYRDPGPGRFYRRYSGPQGGIRAGLRYSQQLLAAGRCRHGELHCRATGRTDPRTGQSPLCTGWSYRGGGIRQPL